MKKPQETKIVKAAAPKGPVALNIGEIKARTEEIVKDCLSRLGVKWNRDFPMPTIDYFSLKGRVAGRADSGANKIYLNYTLLCRNWEDFQRRTIPHEVCHLVANRLWARPQPHGPEWQGLMVYLGYPCTPCHTYDLTAVFAEKNVTTYKYKCMCRKGNKIDGAPITYALTEKQHNGIKNGGFLRCKKCHAKLTLLS
jgi:SprT protein